MNVMTPIVDLRSAYAQLDQLARKFVDGYVRDLENAADQAGESLLVASTRPIPFALNQRGQAMLALPMVRAAIAERIREISDLTDISIARTLKELAAIAYSNIGNYIKIDKWGEPSLDWSKCTPEMLSAVKQLEWEIKPQGGQKIKFTLHDKTSALISGMMKYQGLLKEDNEDWTNKERTLKKVVDNKQIPKNMASEDITRLWAQQLDKDK